jgi:ATP-dependent Clp protease ATP-binding subunit ClpA
VGFGGADGGDRGKGDIEREYKQLFSPEFRNRLDAKIQFKPLAPETMLMVVGKFVRELKEQLEARKVTIELTDAATAYLAREGFDADNGARPLARVMQEQVKRPLGDELLFGKLENGGHVVVDAEKTGTEEKLVFRFEEGESHQDAKAPSEGGSEIGTA